VTRTPGRPIVTGDAGSFDARVDCDRRDVAARILPDVQSANAFERWKDHGENRVPSGHQDDEADDQREDKTADEKIRRRVGKMSRQTKHCRLFFLVFGTSGLPRWL